MVTKRKYTRYFVGKVDKVNPKSRRAYEKYRKSKISKDTSVKETTYKTYENYFNQFLVFIMENYDDMYVYEQELLDDMVDILEDFIVFCTETLGNNKKVINTKLSAISSFYIWAKKRRLIDKHPFAGELERMKGAKEEKLIGNYFLNDEQIKLISKGLKEGSHVSIPSNINESELDDDDIKDYTIKFDMQDLLIWHIALDSGNRLGALSKLELEKLDLTGMYFEDVREKLGKLSDVTFNEYTRDLIKHWLEMRKDMDNLSVNNIFITKWRGEYKAMDKQTIYMRVKKMGKIIGLEDFRPHCIRKTTINRIVEKTGDLSLAQEFAGHESPETTSAHYVRPKSKSELRDRLKDALKEVE